MKKSPKYYCFDGYIEEILDDEGIGGCDGVGSNGGRDWGWGNVGSVEYPTSLALFEKVGDEEKSTNEGGGLLL
ncbi:hypothetical protein FRX31_005194 [Thalictrum thalictroides]|uniref:Uncharacterized protein n=1 Tax=Thalictrum thalictroides TaxID=46969 RepID=A0A7J6X6C3_THATH|nr:hypothetical protein FRX31_005194 [Thalictrum thalictroides]